MQYFERRRWLAISITIVAGLLLGLGFSLWQREQPYRERPVSRLIAELQKRDSPFNLIHQRLWLLLPDRLQAAMGGRFAPMPAKLMRLDAAAELRDREPKPTNALPALRLLLRDRDMDLREAALKALQGMGTAAHPLAADVRALVEDQVGSTIDIRMQAITTLAWIARDDPSTAAALVEVMKERPTNGLAAGRPSVWGMIGVRHAAASALGGLARPGNGVVPALVAALKESEPGFGASLVEALGQARPEEPEAVRAVIAAFERSRKLVAVLHAESTGNVSFSSFIPMSPPPEEEWRMFRSRSLAALQSLARPENGAVAALLSALTEADAGFASEILFALGRIGPITPEVVPAIVNVMERLPTPAAFDALAQRGPAAALAVPSLLAMLRPLAARLQPPEQPSAALVPQDTPLPGAFPVSPARESPSWVPSQFQFARRTQIGRFSLPLRTLGKMGPPAREALPLLATIIQVQTNFWRYEALIASWQIDHDTSSALPGLIEGLADPDRETRLRLVQCFQEMKTEGLAGLIAALGNGDSEVRKSAVQALGELGHSAEKAVPQLEPLLEDPKNIVRFATENALRQIQPSQAAKWKAKLRMPDWSRATAP